MSSSREIISEFIEFVESPTQQNKLVQLEIKLLKVYQLVVQLKGEYSDFKEVEDSIEYQETYKKVSSDFPEMSYFLIVINPLKLSGNPEFGTGDATDDLTDILIDLKRCLLIESDPGFEWQLKFLFEKHIKTHIIALLGYLNELRESAK